MSLLIISPYFFQETAARAIQVRKLVKGLAEAGLPFYLATNCQSRQEKKYGFDKIIGLSNNACWYDKPFKGALSQDLNKLLSFIRENKIETILSITSPVYSSFLGLFLKRHYKKIRLICYFSDPVPENILPVPYFQGYKSNFHKIDCEIQKSNIQRLLLLADKIIIPSVNTLKCFEDAFETKIRHKSCIIPHIGGKLSIVCKDLELKKYLVHIGSMYNRFSVHLIEACKLARKNFPEKFQGLLCYGAENAFNYLVKKNHAEDVVTVKSAVTYEHSLELMRQAEVLLLLEAEMDHSPFMPSKYFDYLFSNRPILAVSPKDNSLSEFYNSSQDLLVIRNEQKEIYNAIEFLFQKTDLIINRNLEHLESRKIIEKYLKVIQEVYSVI